MSKNWIILQMCERPLHNLLRNKSFSLPAYGEECEANGHEITDLGYIKSRIDYVNGNPCLLGEFVDSVDAAKFFASDNANSLCLYEFSSPVGRCIAFDWIYIEGWDV